jgi:hypothetical protein
MPVASEEQVPKPLTYTLMYHFLWCVMFVLSAILLWSVLLASGQRSAGALLAPLAVVVFALVAGAGALATYEVRVRLLLGEITKEEAFHWSAVSSRAVIVFVPLAFVAWKLVRAAWGAGWLESVAAQMTEWLLQVEAVVWWLSHLLSVRGLARGRRKYLAGPPAAGKLPGGPSSGAAAGPDTPAALPASAVAGEHQR